MKRVVLLILFLILILISVLFYFKYFQKKEAAEIKEIDKSVKSLDQKKSNFIKNLNYEISTNEQTEYKITSKLSEITYEGGEELILMNDVNAILRNTSNEDNFSFFISSEKGKYNNYTYHTKFNTNVEIRYLDNIILADELILNLENNLIFINNNVKYSGPVGVLKADNIKIDLITLKIDIFMNDKSKNISFISN